MLNILSYIIPPQLEGNFLPTQTSNEGALYYENTRICYYLLQYYFYRTIKHDNDPIDQSIQI